MDHESKGCECKPKIEDYTKQTLEGYIRRQQPTIDHAMRCEVNQETGEIRCYIHPDGVDGETFDFTIAGNLINKIG